MVLNSAGHKVSEWWQRLEDKFDDIQLNLFVVMPNHFHGIFYINRKENSQTTTSLPEAIHWFKTTTTNAYIRGMKSDDWQHFNGRLWQHSYHDHIIRNEPDLIRILAYLQNNPARWEADTYYK